MVFRFVIISGDITKYLVANKGKSQDSFELKSNVDNSLLF